MSSISVACIFSATNIINTTAVESRRKEGGGREREGVPPSSAQEHTDADTEAQTHRHTHTHRINIKQYGENSLLSTRSLPHPPPPSDFTSLVWT